MTKMETEHINLCNTHTKKLFSVEDLSFGWKRYILDNTPILGSFTICDYWHRNATDVLTECTSPATNLFERTWTCRCCGKHLGHERFTQGTKFNNDKFPIHTMCIPKHWSKHSHGVNVSRCKEFSKRRK